MNSSGGHLVWITGAEGFIGSYFLQTARKKGWAFGIPAHEVIGLSRAMLDLTDSDAVRERFRRDQPALIIHCAALSRSVVCEQEPALARKVNVEVTKLLADLAREAAFVFFSTDLVFDGRKGWYDETSPVNPLTAYAETKAAAEQIVLENPRHTVIRTSLNGGISPAGDRSFNEELRRAWRAGKIPRLFVDEFRCPIPAVETARTVWELVERGATGLFHVAGKERLSRWQIGELLAARWPDLQARIEAGSIRDFQGPPRSADTSLNCVKVEILLQRQLPGLTEWLRRHPQEPF